jgi:predicted SAM-dependent methyltransferase
MYKEEGVKLHLGCGNIIIPGFINADITPHQGVDLICDLNNLNELKTQSWYGKVTFIYLSHVLEHFETERVPFLLKELYEILGENGTIRISVPDLDKICILYVKNFDWFKPPHNPWLGLIYGGQTDKYDFHKTGFNFCYLEWLLSNTGFTNIKEINGSSDLGIHDGSLSNLPFGNISLNVEAYKGNTKSSSKKFQYTFIEKLMGRLTVDVERIIFVLVRVRIALIRRRIKRLSSFQIRK